MNKYLNISMYLDNLTPLLRISLYTLNSSSVFSSFASSVKEQSKEVISINVCNGTNTKGNHT